MLRARRSRRFLMVLLALLTPVIGALLLGALILWRAGEFISEAEILEGMGTGELPVVHRFDDRAYRRALLELQKADVVIFGASRALRFRADMFTAPFVNLAAGQVSPEALVREADYYFANRKPRYVLWSLNFQNFNDGRQTVVAPPRNPSILRNRLLLPYKLVLEGRLEWSDLADVLLGRTAEHSQGVRFVGLMARTRHAGLGVDGAKIYTGAPVQGNHLHIHDKAWRDVAFLAGKGIGEEQIVGIARAVDEFARRGMILIPFAAPYAPTAWEVLSDDPDFTHIRRWAATMTARVPNFQNFLDPAAISTTDCEFLDDNHGGDVAYFRLLQAWAARDPQGLGRMIALDRMSLLAATHAGEVNVPAQAVIQRMLPVNGAYVSTKCLPQ